MVQRWAITQAMFANVNFLERDSSGRAVGEPFTADDFMGRGNREVRTMEKKLGSAQAQLINAQLARIQPGQPVDESILPDWAKGEYQGA